MPRAQQAKYIFWFAVVFLLLNFAIFCVLLFATVDEQSRAFSQLMWLSRAVSAACVGAAVSFLPGALQINWLNSAGIKAGGAIAAFVLVYLVNPPEFAAEQGKNLRNYEETLARCENGLLTASGPTPEARTNCPLLMEIDPERWESHYNLGRIEFWNGNYDVSIELHDRALEIIRSEAFVPTEDIFRVIYGANFSRLSRLSEEDLSAVIDSASWVMDEIGSGDPRLKIQYVLQYASAVLWQDNLAHQNQNLYSHDSWFDHADDVLARAQDRATWLYYYHACLQAVNYQNRADEVDLDIIRQDLDELVRRVNSRIAANASAQGRLLRCLLDPHEQGNCDYRAGMPPRCAALYTVLDENYLELLGESVTL